MLLNGIIEDLKKKKNAVICIFFALYSPCSWWLLITDNVGYATDSRNLNVKDVSASKNRFKEMPISI